MNKIIKGEYEIIVRREENECYIEILDITLYEKYSLKIDKMIMDDIRVIHNIDQMYKILTSINGEDRGIKTEIKKVKEKLEMRITIMAVVEINFVLIIPKYKSEMVDMERLQQKVDYYEKKMNELNEKVNNFEIIIKKLNNKIEEMTEGNKIKNDEYFYTIKDNNGNSISAVISSNYKKINASINTMYINNNIPIIKNININNIDIVGQITHNLDELILSVNQNMPVTLNMKKIKKLMIICYNDIDFGKLFKNIIEIEEIVICGSNNIDNISNYLGNVRGLKKIIINNCPKLANNDYKLRQEKRFIVEFT